MPVKKAQDTDEKYYVNTDEGNIDMKPGPDILFKPGVPVKVPLMWIEDCDKNVNLSPVESEAKVDKAALKKLRVEKYKTVHAARNKWRDDRKAKKKAPEEANAPPEPESEGGDDK